MPSQPKVSKAALNKIWLTAGLLAGCTAPKDSRPPIRSSEPPTPATFVSVSPPATVPATVDPVIATVGPTKVRQAELQAALMEAYGFNLLMLVVQRDMARDACVEQHLVVTPADVKNEYDFTVDRMFPDLGPKDDREKLLDQYLAQPKPKDQAATRTELTIIIETNAYLRKLVEPTIGKSVTDDMLRQQFDDEYASQARVRDLVVANPQEAAERRRQLDAGADFAALVRQYSREPNAEVRRSGGLMPPFTSKSTRVPENIRSAAFSLKPGEVSDLVQANGGYHLIKLEQVVAQKAVKFADVKDGLRQDYVDKLVLEGVKGVKGRLAQQALTQLAITEPTLKSEFDTRLAARDRLVRDREKIRQDLERDRLAARQPATVPATRPAPATTATTRAAPPAAAPRPATEPAVPPPAIGRTPTATEPVAPPAPPTPPPPVVAPPAATAPKAAPPATRPAVVAPAAATGPSTRPS